MEELHDHVLSAVRRRRKKLTESKRKRQERRAGKLRKLRKFRSKVKRADKGMPMRLQTGGGKLERTRWRFYFDTYTSKGEHAGTHWMPAAKPSKKAIESYEKQHRYKHPFMLPMISESQLKDKQALRKKKKQRQQRQASKKPKRPR